MLKLWDKMLTGPVHQAVQDRTLNPRDEGKSGRSGVRGTARSADIKTMAELQRLMPLAIEPRTSAGVPLTRGRQPEAETDLNGVKRETSRWRFLPSFWQKYNRLRLTKRRDQAQ